jgi:hypothetical protein
MTRQRTRPAPFPCVPTGNLTTVPPIDACMAGHPLMCSCGDPLRAVPTPDGRDWSYVSARTGRGTRDDSPPGYQDDPAGWWDMIKRDHIEIYLSISAALELNGGQWTHPHVPASCDHLPHPSLPPVPECCGTPMWYTPAGWRCRVNRTLVTADPATVDLGIGA